MSKRDFDRWVGVARAVAITENPLRMSYDVALREAAQVAAFVGRYWEPSGDRPGLSRVKKRLPKEIAGDILSLVRAVQHAQTSFLTAVDATSGADDERARELVDLLESAIAFVLDDGVNEAAAKQLANIRSFHAKDGARSSALAQALRDYAALAAKLGGG